MPTINFNNTFFKAPDFKAINLKPFYLRFFLLLCLYCFVQTSFATEDSVNWRYTVRPNDNLINIAEMHLINPDDWKVIQQLNHIKNPHHILVGTVLKVPVILVKQEPMFADVLVVSGTAEMQVGINSYQALTVGQKLGPGARIKTTDNSKVVLQFADGSQTSVASNSMLVLDELSAYSGGMMVDTKMRLQQGQIETKANPSHSEGNRMQVITPSAIAAVRGTEFRVSAGQASMTQETLTGQIALNAAGEEIDVPQGFGSVAELGKPPMPPVKLLPAIDPNSLQNKYETLPITFNMPTLAGAAAWAGKVSPDIKFDDVLSEAESQQSQLIFADVPDGKYYLSVRAKDKQGLAGYDAVKQFDVNARPFPPVHTFPALDVVIREPKPALQWSVASDAQAYLVELALDENFNDVFARERTQTNEYRLNKTLVPGDYFWRVASVAKTAEGQDDQGPFMNVSRFSYKAMPPKPDISQLKVDVKNNAVFIDIAPAKDGYTYQVNLHNEKNNQKNVWAASSAEGKFNFLLKEYGQQTLSIRYLDADGVIGPAAIYQFNADPE